MTTPDDSALKARNSLFALFCTLTILDSILVAVSRDLWAVGRIIVTIVVMYYVLQGKKWAKWVLISILSLVVILLTALIVALHTKLSSFLIFGSIGLIVLNIITVIFMVSSQDLKHYFSFKRKIVHNS